MGVFVLMKTANGGRCSVNGGPSGCVAPDGYGLRPIRRTQLEGNGARTQLEGISTRTKFEVDSTRTQFEGISTRTELEVGSTRTEFERTSIRM